MKITVAGTGYVGLSNAILLAQHNEVIALDIIQEKVDLINNKKFWKMNSINFILCFLFFIVAYFIFLLAQHNEVIALDIIQEKVDLINNKKSPIVDKEIEEYLSTKELNLAAISTT